MLKVCTWLSIPSIRSMEKKRMAQRGEMGNWVTASGYARNANPGPGKEENEKEVLSVAVDLSKSI